jgi:NADPH-dependent ferric siderophore reductase
MSFSYASVIETIQLTPRLRRITLRVDDPEALEVKPGGDSAVGITRTQLLSATP